MSIAVVIAGNQYCIDQDTEIIVRSKSLFGSAYEVTDMAGNLLLKTESSRSWSKKSVCVKDPQHNDATVLTMSHNFFSPHGTWKAYDSQQQHQQQKQTALFKAKRSSIFDWGTTLLRVYVNKSSKEEPAVKVRCCWKYSYAKVFDRQGLIAERASTVMQALLGKEKMVISIQAGTDFTFVAALALILLDSPLKIGGGS